MKQHNKKRVIANAFLSEDPLRDVFNGLKRLRVTPGKNVLDGESAWYDAEYLQKRDVIDKLYVTFRMNYDGQYGSSSNNRGRNDRNRYEVTVQGDYLKIRNTYDGKSYKVFDADGALQFFIDVSEEHGFRCVQASTRIGRKSVKASEKKIRASAKRIRASVNASTDPFKLIERSRYGFINEWDEIAEENEATPDTSWNNIFDNALDEFKIYTEDEASGFLLDKFRSGEITERDMLEEFEQFVMIRDLDDFDF